MPHGLSFPPKAVSSVAEALQRMKDLESTLPRNDGLECFNRMYVQTTTALEQKIGDGFFEDPAFMAHLDVVFANLYFAAADGWSKAPAGVARSWAALLEDRGDTRVAPIQFALAGMNAHINHDLPLAVFQACIELATAPEDHLGDYDKVNPVLAAIEQDVRTSFLADLPPGLVLDDVQNSIDSWSIDSARAAAWVQAELFWHVRALPPLVSAYEKVLDRSVGFAGRGLLAVRV